MVIPANLKILSIGLLLGGLSAFAYSTYQKSSNLDNALLEIGKAQTLIDKASITIQNAQKDITLTRDTLQYLSKLADQTRNDLGKLREERFALVKDFQNNLRKNVADVKDLLNTVSEFEKERRKLEHKIQENYSQDSLIFYPKTN